MDIKYSDDLPKVALSNVLIKISQKFNDAVENNESTMDIISYLNAVTVASQNVLRLQNPTIQLGTINIMPLFDGGIDGELEDIFD